MKNLKEMFNINKNTQNIWTRNWEGEDDLSQKPIKETKPKEKISKKVTVPQQKPVQEAKTVEKIVYVNKKKNRFKKPSKIDGKAKAIIITVVIGIIALLLLPVAILFGLSTILIDKELLSSNIGYVLDETEFSVKNIKTGKYIKEPEYYGEKLMLSSDESITYKFTSQGHKNNILLESENYFEGQNLIANAQGDQVIWTTSGSNDGISLVKKSENENLFAIRFENEKKFLNATSSNTLGLSYEKDWFQFYAKTEFIETTKEYEDAYYHNNNSSSADYNVIGAEANPLYIRSTKTNKYLNSYKDIDDSELPFIDLYEDSFEDQLVMKDEVETNLFIPDTYNGDLSIGSYQTLPIRSLAKYDWMKYYPTLSVNKDGEVQLNQFPNSHLLPDTENLTKDSGDIENPPQQPEADESAKIKLLPNPTNKREFAIYFNQADKFLWTENDKLTLVDSPDLDDKEAILGLEYFEFKHSVAANPETFALVPAMDSPTQTLFSIVTELPDAVDGFEFRAYGVDSDFIQRDYKYKEINSSKKGYQSFWQKDLSAPETYFGTLTMWREGDKVGKHKSTIIMGTFGNFPDGGGNNGGITDPELPAIDPGNPGNGDQPSVNTRIWESIDEIGPTTENDVPVDEMLDKASNTAEISLEFLQGWGQGKTDSLRVKLQEVDTYGNVIGSEIYSNNIINPEDGLYTFNVGNLKEETRYLVTTQYGDWANNQINYFDQKDPAGSLGLDEGVEQMYITTERIAPDLITESLEFDDSLNSLGIFMMIKNLKLDLNNKEKSDKIRILITPTKDLSHTSVDSHYMPANDFNNEGVEDTYSYLAKNITAGEIYSVNVWIKMDGYDGWEESPVWDDTQQSQGPGGFQYINIINEALDTTPKKSTT